MTGYQIQLDNFTGPLDLLLFFIRRDEIDIMDIPIARIAEEYLAHLDTLRTLNVAIAGEFIMMAAMLMRIKARMLIPHLSVDGDEEEVVDPRAELVQQLLEYQRFKEAAGSLSSLIESQIRKFSRPENLDYRDAQEDQAVYLEEVSVFELASMFKELLDKMPHVVTYYDLPREEVKVKEKIAYLLTQFVLKKRLMFSELFSDFYSRQELIATFIAILELVREGQLQVLQRRPFIDFALEWISPESRELPHPPAVGEA